MKKHSKIVMIIIIISIATLFMLTGCSGAGKPTVKEHDFDFSITYAVDGEETVIDGVFSCRFLRSGKAVDGIYRDWEGTIEGKEPGDRYYEILKTDDVSIVIDTCLFADYLMGDSEEHRSDGPELYIVENIPEDPSVAHEIPMYDKQDLSSEGYNIKIISWDYPQPIENEFK